MSWRLRIILLVMSLAVLSAARVSTTMAQEPDCRFFKVAANALNIFKDPSGASGFVDRLVANDVVCVTRQQRAGNSDWAYIDYRLEKQNRRTALAGWGTMASLRPATPDEVAALRNAPAPAPAPAPVATPAPAPPSAPVATPPSAPPTPTPAPPAVTATSEDEVRFSKPITFGPPPVNGHSLEELINAVPLFSPIEGLDESVWKKTCDGCHKWDRQTLCVQAGVYVKNPRTELRIPHPFGGAEKIAMLKWAQGGCQ